MSWLENIGIQPQSNTKHATQLTDDVTRIIALCDRLIKHNRAKEARNKKRISSEDVKAWAQSVFTHASKALDQPSMSEVLKEIRAVSAKTDVIDKDLTVIKTTVINDIKASKTSTAITGYANIRSWTQIVKAGPPSSSLTVPSSAQTGTI